MNALFIFAGALEMESNHARLQEFWRLDKEIAHWQETKTYKELFHSLEYSTMLCRAKMIVKQLNY